LNLRRQSHEVTITAGLIFVAVPMRVPRTAIGENGILDFRWRVRSA
jgi:hypothetical protein